MVMSNVMSKYAKVFGSGNVHWEKGKREYNLVFLRAKEAYANDRLQVGNLLFLNDVYDMLGIPRTKTGQFVGWRYDTMNPIGDNRVEFQIMEKDDGTGFVVDFNVDGNIIDFLED